MNLKLSSYLYFVQKLKTFSKNMMIGFLALLLFANVTFAHSLDYHMCQGELQSVAIFGKKATCSKMMKAEADSLSGFESPRSCCDVKKKYAGYVFKQKSCCDNILLVQDNVLQKPSIDLQKASSLSLNFINNFTGLELKIIRAIHVVSKVEIPPPPNILQQHSQESLQVFII